MKKILSKKLQLRSTTIATLTGPGLRIVKGGTNDDGADGGGDIGGTTEGAGVRSRMDHNGNPDYCQNPITDP